MIKFGSLSGTCYVGTASVTAMYFGTALVYSGSTTPPPTGSTMTQQVNVNFVDGSGNYAEPNWNSWIPYVNSTTNLLNPTGSTTGIRLVDMSGNWVNEDEGINNIDPDFPVNVMRNMVFSENDKTIKFTGLDVTKRYLITFAASQNYNDINDSTTVTVNGVATEMGGPAYNNVVAKKTVIANYPPSGEILIKFSPTLANGYGCMNAMILREYISS